MVRWRILLSLSLLSWTLACAAPAIFSLTPTPTPYLYPTPETPNVPALAVDQLKNAEYLIVGFDGASHTYRFADGKYVRGTDTTSPDYADLRLLDFFAFGDLNRDGVNDAAVLIAENYGGRALVSVAAVRNEAGQPRHMASYLVDDRPQVNTLEIRGGRIFLDALVHHLDDAMCCPTFPVTQTFQLFGNSLTLVRAASQTPGGGERAITIESPSEGAAVGGALVVSGSVTIAPFENTLSYHVYTEQGNELAAGPILVSAPDFGAPGTFTFPLDPSAFPLGRVRIVISDLGAADGSVLALDSVEVVVR